jgi:hypothetical protein
VKKSVCEKVKVKVGVVREKVKKKKKVKKSEKICKGSNLIELRVKGGLWHKFFDI